MAFCIFITNRKLLFFASIILLLTAYSNNLTGEWHFDDLPNIVLNTNIQPKKLTYQEVRATISKLISDKDENRPVSMFSFAGDFLISGNNTISYHLTNIIIHIFCFSILVHVIILLYQTPAIDSKNPVNSYTIALLSALLWAANPIQTQAVTYIVQRMASLATLFYLASIFFFLKLRTNKNTRSQLIYSCLVVIFFILAFFSKENAVTLPIAILLIELIFFQDNSSWRQFNQQIVAILLCIFFIFIICLVIFKPTQFTFLTAYQYRFFSLEERLLTESRILVYYLSLIFYPNPNRLSLSHDIILSQSIFTPPTTILSIITIILLLSTAILYIKKYPVYSFAILFFFLNHLIESTFIPLELIFEHRNYLPSLFIFWPVSVFLFSVTKSFNTEFHHHIKWLVALSIIFIFLFSTYKRNEVWKTEYSLWSDAHQKAPASARPVFFLGVDAAVKGDLMNAIELYKKSLTLTAHKPSTFKALTHKNIADLYLESNQTNLAIEHYEKSLIWISDNPYTLYMLAYCHYLQRDYEKTKILLLKVIHLGKAAEKTHGLLGKIFLMTGKSKKAIEHLTLSLQNKNNDLSVSIDLAQSLLFNHDISKALKVLEELEESNYFPTPTPLILKILTLHTLKKTFIATRDTKFLLEKFPFPDIIESIKTISEILQKTDNNEELLDIVEMIHKQIVSSSPSAEHLNNEIF